MNAGQYEGLMGRLGEILDRMPDLKDKPSKVREEPAQHDPGPTVLSPAGWPVKLTDTRTPVKLTDPDHRAAASLALYSLLVNLDGWIDGARSNHDGLDHRGEPMGEECWTQYHPADIRNMVNDVARELGLGEFPKPTTPREDEVR